MARHLDPGPSNCCCCVAVALLALPLLPYFSSFASTQQLSPLRIARLDYNKSPRSKERRLRRGSVLRHCRYIYIPTIRAQTRGIKDIETWESTLLLDRHLTAGRPQLWIQPRRFVHTCEWTHNHWHPRLHSQLDVFDLLINDIESICISSRCSNTLHLAPRRKRVTWSQKTSLLPRQIVPSQSRLQLRRLTSLLQVQKDL